MILYIFIVHIFSSDEGNNCYHSELYKWEIFSQDTGHFLASSNNN